MTRCKACQPAYSMFPDWEPEMPVGCPLFAGLYKRHKDGRLTWGEMSAKMLEHHGIGP